jgi:AcrR family transcriptional regulator
MSKREQGKEETRKELIAAATAVFSEQGFHRAGISDIARQAGFTTGAVYHHFPGGKDELFLAAYESYALTRVNELAQIRDNADGPLPKRTRAFADHWMARQAQEPMFMVVALEFAAHAARKPDLQRRLADSHAAVRLFLGRALEEEAKAEGIELPLPAQDIATALREMGVGLALAKLSDPDAFPDALYGDFVETFYELALNRAKERK